MHYLCEKNYKPVTVQYYMENCVSWAPKLSLLGFTTNWIYERAFGTELLAGRGLTVDLRTLTGRTTGVAFARGLGQRQRERGTTAQGSWTREGGTGRGAACPDWAWPGKQAGWVAAEAVRTRAGGQSKPPAISSRGKHSLDGSALLFSARETEHPRVGRGGVSTVHGHCRRVRAPSDPRRHPVFWGKTHQSHLPPFIHPSTQQAFSDPMSRARINAGHWG